MTVPTEATTVISGGGTGMGRAVALRLALSGHHVTIVGRRREPLEQTAADAPVPGVIDVVAADLSEVNGAESVRRALGDRPVAGVVAAAGGQGEFIRPAPGAASAERAWTDALGKNFMSAVLLVEELLPVLLDTRGRVVLISSTAALDGHGGPYAAAKAALHGYNMDLARRLGPRAITANVVAPGFIRGTDFFDAGGLSVDTAAEERIAATTIVGRLGHSDDIASCVLWLLAEDSGWTTGQVISPNGGTVLVG